MATINKNLSSRYNAFIAKARPWDFFIGLADYMQYVLDTPELKKVVDEQIAIRDAEYKEIVLLEEQSANEFREAWKKLIAIAKKHDLDVGTFTAFTSEIPAPPGRKIETIPEQMQAFEENRISISGFHSDHLEHFVFDIAANLLKLGYEKELADYIVTVQEAISYFGRINGNNDGGEMIYAGNTYGNFIFSKTWPERFAKVRRVEKARDLKSWGAFEDLLKFWQARQEVLNGAGFYEAMKNVSSTEYKFGGSDALEVAWAAKDLETLQENHDTTEKELHFLRVEDFRTRTTTVAGVLLSSLPENNTPEAKRRSRAMNQAFEKIKDNAWRGSMDARLSEIEEITEQKGEKPTGNQKILDALEDAMIRGLKNISLETNPVKELSSANRKKSFILGKLKDEWDLTSKKPVTTPIRFGYYYTHPAGEAKVSQQKFSTWMSEGGVSDWYELESILIGFQERGLISDFKIQNEYE